jgi:hypothetical protein
VEFAATTQTPSNPAMPDCRHRQAG